MNATTEISRDYSFTFQGKGSQYFGVVVVNWLLTIITLGLYYPWAKARQLQYLYGSTELNNSNFSFTGTGKEMFIGFLKAIGLFIIIYGTFFLFVSLKMLFLGVLVLYLGILSIIPFAIHGSYRYRMSRTFWRGIRFSYRGDKKELYTLFFKSIFLTVITLGIYGAWMVINLRNYLLSNIHFGNLRFKYTGRGSDYFVLNLKGYLLTIVTLGIYSFWWFKDLYEYYINHLELSNGNEKIQFKSKATAGKIFKLLLGNFLLIVFTLGLAYPWVVTRSMDFLFANVEMKGNLDLDSIEQIVGKEADATGEDVSDMLDMDFVI